MSVERVPEINQTNEGGWLHVVEHLSSLIQVQERDLFQMMFFNPKFCKGPNYFILIQNQSIYEC